MSGLSGIRSSDCGACHGPQSSSIRSQSSHYTSRSRTSADLTIRTEEGDTVRLSYTSRTSQSSAVYFYNRSGEGLTESGTVARSDFSSDLDYTVRVKGNLNEQELADVKTAIQALSEAQSGNTSALAALNPETLTTVSDLRYRLETHQQTKVTTRDTRLEISRPAKPGSKPPSHAFASPEGPVPTPQVARLPEEVSEQPQTPTDDPLAARHTLDSLG